MTKKSLALLIGLCIAALLLSGCGAGNTSKTAGINFAQPDYDKDFSTLRTPGSQESAYDYRLFFLPAVDGLSQPYVGDPMPYYENGVFYLYYLKEAGDSYNHSIYLTTTTDFQHFTEYDSPIIEASRSGGQDGWTGTGSVVKVDDAYYFFYTGHASSDSYEYKEKIMVAKGDSPLSFTKVEGWALTPPAELGQKNDFRDPQAYYDAEKGVIELTVTAAQGGVARVVKFTLAKDLNGFQYDGVIVTDPTRKFWNLECSDTFRLGDKYYITYSGQDDTLWYAFSDTPYGPYNEPRRLDGKLFYAAKHVEDGEKCFLVGWARRSESPSSTQEVSAWGGNLIAQQLDRAENGDLILKPLDTVRASFTDRRQLLFDDTACSQTAGARYTYTEAFTAYERFLLTGEFRFTGDGSFGLAFDYSGREDKYKLISLNPAEGLLRLSFNEGSTPITETVAPLEKGKTYSFTYLQEGSVGVFYVDGVAALTVRLYGVSGKAVRLFAENNQVEWQNLCEYTCPVGEKK
ncbi:MAG: hypothetical protein IJS41_09745 [Clostridia bacterium]|nr:hypothetical protein [Clostridia bacterium]